jgi:hypothetical protein
MAKVARRTPWGRLNAIHADKSASDTIRLLGSFEHMFWLIDQNRPVHFALTAQITGKASPDDWRQALDRVQGRHPIFSVCIEGSPGSVPRFRQVAAAIPLRIVEGNPRTSWGAEVGEELATPFDPSQAPLIRALLIQDSQSTAFTLVAHHSIADGLSIAYAIRDTLSAISGGLLEPLPLSPSQEEILGACGGPTAVAGASEQQGHARAENPATYRPLDDARPTVKGLRLAPALTENLRHRAQREGTTVHGALCAALAIAGRKVSADWQEIPLRIASPISTRQILEVGESCGVFLSAVIGVFDWEPVDFWRVARDAKTVVAPGQTRDGVAALLSAFEEVVGNGAEIPAAAEFIAAVFAHEATLTNLGVLTFDSRFGPLQLEAIWGPAVLLGMLGEQTIGVATINGSIGLTHTGYAPPEGLLEEMRNVLIEACQ